MKKALVPILAVIAVAAIVVCCVFGGQKADLQKQVNGLFNQEAVDQAVAAAKEGLFDQAAVDAKVNEAVEAAKAEVEATKVNLFDEETVTGKVNEAVEAAKAEFGTVQGELEAKVADLEEKAKSLFDEEAVNAKVNEAVEAAKTEFDTVKGELEAKVADLEEKAKSLFDEEAVNAKVNEAVEAAKTEFDAVKGELETKVADLEEKAKNLFDEEAVNAKVNEAVEAAKTEWEAAKEAVTEKVEEVKEAAEEKVEEVKEAVEEKVEEVTETVDEKVEEAKDAAEEIVADVLSAAEGVMDHAAYDAAELDSEVCVETYVQAKQSWWDGKLTVYAQSEDGAYFIYNMACVSQEDADALVPGTKIRVTGYKSAWSGEVEIVDATYEIVEGADAFIATPEDLTAVVADESLIANQNKLFAIKGAKVVAYNEAGDAFSYAWDGSGSHDANSDLYFNVDVNGTVIGLTVESYLCDNTTEVYAAVENLKVDDVIDVEGFLYWYEGANPHIISVKVAE